MKKNIVLAKKSDAKEILKLYTGEPNLLMDDKTGYGLKNILDYIANKRSKFFIYKLENKILGALLAEFYCDYVVLYTMVVKKEYRGRGIAKLLMGALENEMKKKKIDLIEAFVEKDNNKMQKLFEKEGYKKNKVFFSYSKNL